MEEVEMKIVLRGRKVIGGAAEGEAVVTKEPVSFLGGVNPDKGDGDQGIVEIVKRKGV